MRTVDEIMADIEHLEEHNRAGRPMMHICGQLERIMVQRLIDDFYEFINLTADIPLDRLESICAAEKDGRCVVLPCKVGDTVYKTKAIFTDYKEPKEEMVVGFAYPWHDPDGDSLLVCCKNGVKIDERQIGKTVFLTRPEAEAALKGGSV